MCVSTLNEKRIKIIKRRGSMNYDSENETIKKGRVRKKNEDILL